MKMEQGDHQHHNNSKEKELDEQRELGKAFIYLRTRIEATIASARFANDLYDENGRNIGQATDMPTEDGWLFFQRFTDDPAPERCLIEVVKHGYQRPPAAFFKGATDYSIEQPQWCYRLHLEGDAPRISYLYATERETAQEYWQRVPALSAAEAKKAMPIIDRWCNFAEEYNNFFQDRA